MRNLANVEPVLEPDDTISAGLWGVYNHIGQAFCRTSWAPRAKRPAFLDFGGVFFCALVFHGAVSLQVKRSRIEQLATLAENG